jgi:HD-GYP domain-containing protein (c-di-GMP phosphodiesterase class II)
MTRPAPPSRQEIVEGALATVRETLGMDAAYLAEFTDGQQVLRALDGDAESFAMRLDEGIPAEGTYCLRMLEGRLPNVVPDSTAEPRVAGLEITERAGIGAYAAVPLEFPDGARGTLCCLSHQPDPSLAERDLRFMRAVARLIEDHLVRHDLEEQLRDSLDIEIVRGSADLRIAVASLSEASADTVLRLSRAVEYRDDDTGAHTLRVARYSEELARAAEVDPGTCEQLLLASPLHDAGKVGIPDAILLKPGKLTSEERAVMQQHSQLGHDLLRDSTFEALELAAEIALTHHEKVDGTGYPNGLRGDTIPLSGRIVAIADVYDALTQDRVYRPRFSVEKATEIMRADRGTHFDPVLLDLFFARVAGQDLLG